MNALEFIAYLRSLDIRLSANDGQLCLSAPKGVLTPALRAELVERKAELLQALDQASGSDWPIEPAPRSAGLPLSFTQQRMWFLDQFDPDRSTYNVSALHRLTGPLNIQALEQSIHELVRRHETLRTTFTASDGQPTQVIAPELTIPLVVHDLRDVPLSSPTRREAQRAQAQEHVMREERGAFDLRQGPLLRTTLLRLSDQEHLLVIVIHHIVSDGWSMRVISQELSSLYAAFSRGEPSPLPDLPIQYADYAVWQRSWLKGERLQSQLAYWRRQLDGCPPLLELPTDYVRPPIQTHRGAKEELVLSRDLTVALRMLGRQEGVTLFMTLFTAFSTLLHRHSGQDDIAIGIPIANRRRTELEGLIGAFINSLVLRTNHAGAPTFRTMLAQVRQVALEAYTHQDIPFEKLLEELQVERDPGRTPLFQVLFNMLTFEESDLHLPGLRSEHLPAVTAESKFDFTLYVKEQAERLLLRLVYNADLFSAERMAEMLAQYEQLLMQIVAEPDQPLHRFSLVTSHARTVLPDPAQAIPAAWFGPVQTQFARQAHRAPNRLAVVDRKDRWTYGELNLRSNQLAHHLCEHGIQPQDVVAIYGHRSASLVWALLGVLKAGAAFCILEPKHPAERLQACLEAIRPRGLIQVKAAGDLPPALADRLSMLSLACHVSLPRRKALTGQHPLVQYPTTDLDIRVSPDDLAYIVFTSGSTGRPKGIQGTHRPLSHFFHWYGQAFELQARDRFSMLSGLAHDPLLRDVFAPLSIGASLYIPDLDHMGARGLFDWLKEHRISVAHLTPATLQWLAPEQEGIVRPTGWLRYAFFGGDALTRQHIAKLRQIAPQAKWANFYGCTETPQVMGFHCAPAQDQPALAPTKPIPLGRVPLGHGIEGVQLLVLNKPDRLAGIGELGEICVRTPYLAKGYLDEQLTRERFVENPFCGENGREPGPVPDRLYRTGDWGRYRPDGQVEFAGRRDDQVKIRGYRIELGEIEARLAEEPALRQAIVVPRIDGSGEMSLVAYVAPHQGQSLTAGEVRSFLQAKLPDYMIPSAFVFLETLPLTPNGKVDRRALPALEQTMTTEPERSASPRDGLEWQLTRIWEEVLGRSSIGIRDNFFDLGGHSLLAVRLFSQIESLTGLRLPLVTLLLSPTIEQLADTLRDKGWTPSWSSLVPIQPEGSRPPLFFVHSGGGSVMGYYDLARFLGPDQPFYGLQAPGLGGKIAPFRRYRDMAGHYIAEIRTVQPRGPYFLGGFCMGGGIALEMAQQLKRQGDDVGLLVMVETRNREAYPRCRSDTTPWQRQVYRAIGRVDREMSNLAEVTPGERLAYAAGRIKRLMSRVQAEAEGITRPLLIRLGRPAELSQIGVLRNLERVHREAARCYSPQPFSGAVVIFRARKQPLGIYPDPMLGWGELLEGERLVAEIPGHASGMLSEPRVRIVAEHLRACLDQVQRTRLGPCLRTSVEPRPCPRRRRCRQYPDSWSAHIGHSGPNA
jgi:amino acid adenylation domain-containing protein